jgi:hypothetical protein
VAATYDIPRGGDGASVKGYGDAINATFIVISDVEIFLLYNDFVSD